MNIPKENIILLSWFKNNVEWYIPTNNDFLTFDSWEHFEILHYYNDNNFLVYCWNGLIKCESSRLFKAKVK